MMLVRCGLAPHAQSLQQECGNVEVIIYTATTWHIQRTPFITLMWILSGNCMISKDENWFMGGGGDYGQTVTGTHDKFTNLRMNQFNE